MTISSDRAATEQNNNKISLQNDRLNLANSKSTVIV